MRNFPWQTCVYRGIREDREQKNHEFARDTYRLDRYKEVGQGLSISKGSTRGNLRCGESFAQSAWRLRVNTPLIGRVCIGFGYLKKEGKGSTTPPEYYHIFRSAIHLENKLA